MHKTMAMRMDLMNGSLPGLIARPQDFNISDDARLLRGGVEVALTKAKSDRTQGKVRKARSSSL